MSNEADWTKGTLIPLLRRLGFIKVEYTHGQMEHGRDVVFAEIDRFGLLRYYGAQVKMGGLNADHGGVAFQGVVAQLKTAWDQPYKDLADGTEHRLSGVYLVVSGNITSVARDRLYELTGQWLHLVDADQLAVAEHSSWTTISTIERLRLLTMAEIELKGYLTPDLRRLAEALAVEGIELRLPQVCLTASSLLRACELLQYDVVPEDLVVLYKVYREAGVIDATLARIPMGVVSGIEPTLRGLQDKIVKLLPYCEIAERILEAAASTERPTPGQQLPRITPTEWSKDWAD